MSRSGRFSTALREDAREQIESLASADIVIGIPAYYSDDTIAHVIKTAAQGLDRYYGKRSLILIADGGSTDDTREVARSIENHLFNLDTLVTIYRGSPGKGSAFRAVFEAAKFLRARAVAVFDSDLKSIEPKWVKNLIDPVLEGYDFVAPDYNRYKFDGTITNTIAYNLTRALYGVNIRQPIGGDFGLSIGMVKHYLEQDVWESDIAKFGVDIWMTTEAITGGFKICQAKLGTKVHGEKDPAADLGPMFREVVGTIFTLMATKVAHWQQARETVTPPIFGEVSGAEPEPFAIDHEALIDYFRIGQRNFGSVWKNIIDPQDIAIINSLAETSDTDNFELPTATWVRTVYRYARTFNSAERQRFKLLDTMIPLYNARVATLVKLLQQKNQQEAEEFYEEQARRFEEMRDYLLDIWQ
jgi:glycosyltransferase involved in cell wall biosynthesis